ncbi:MAG: hypothetical protein ABIT58_01705 [Ferruginibacter sp.]
MKKNIRVLLVLALVLSISFLSCKKDRDSDSSTDLATHADDQSGVAAGTDDIALDANNIAATFNAFGKVEAVANLPCNATATLDSTTTTKTITVVYNGANCPGTRNRVGTVVLSMPILQRWGDVGAVLTIETQSLTITRLVDNKSISISGSMIITNVSGGRVINLTTGSPAIIHDITSPGLTVTFDNGTQRNWQVAKRRTFTYDGGIVITTEGTHTEAGISNISEWGTNRYGNPFTASITASMVIRQDCSFRLVSGQITHQGALGTVVATFGLDATGNTTGCPGLTGNYYFKAVWTGNNGNVRTVIRPY